MVAGMIETTIQYSSTIKSLPILRSYIYGLTTLLKYDMAQFGQKVANNLPKLVNCIVSMIQKYT